MPITFFLKKIISVLLVPPLMPIILIGLGLVLLQFRPRLGKYVAWLGLAITIFLSTPASVDLLTGPLEKYPVITPQGLRRAQAIVILAGGQRGYAAEYGGSTPTRLTFERIRYGARLAKRSGLPVLTSGGTFFSRQKPEAELIAESLHTDFGIDTKWIEGRSLDTADNARYSAEILKQAGIHTIALVTHAAHMRRAVNEFREQGLDVIPAPTAFFTGGPGEEEFVDFIPNMTSAYSGWYAVHEWLGLAAQWVRFKMHMA
ncbi:MAG TPA: YdcF family protein [Rhodocyclaceae bacterium]|nr:YdcF family protein [Rhodocyclaceae bacterium]